MSSPRAGVNGTNGTNVRLSAKRRGIRQRDGLANRGALTIDFPNRVFIRGPYQLRRAFCFLVGSRALTSLR